MDKNTSAVLEAAQSDTKKPFFLRRIQAKITTSRSAYLSFCFVVPIVLTYLVYLAMEIHPFGDGSVLVLDLNAQYVYFFEAFREFIFGNADPLYSFSRAVGGEFVGMYAYYLASPLSFIVALFPKTRMLEALLTMFLTKAGLCGLTFGFYLHKNSKNPNKVIIVAFSAMYALCAFAVVHQNNTMWTDALILLPLLTYGIEQLVKFGKFKLFVITLALTVWSNYYIGYMVCIYVAAYFFYYCAAYGDGKSNPLGKRAHFVRSLVRIAVFSAIAISMVAFIILGAYYSLSFGKNEFSSPDWTPAANFNVLDFLTKFLPGAYDTVRPEGLPFVYTGLLTVFLIPVYFMSKKISAREKIASGALLGFFALSFFLSTLDLIWHGFQAPNWLNNRYSFMFCFIMLVLAYKGFGNLRRVSEKFILAICAFILLFVAVCEKHEFETYVESDSKLLTLQTVWLSIIAALAFLAILCMLMRTKNAKKREGLAGILAVVVCIELFCNALTCVIQFDGDVLYSGYSGYNDFLAGLREVTTQIDEGDRSFYRAEKTAHRTVNDNMALGLKGVSNSTSTLNKDTIEFLNNMGYCAHSHWSQYLGGTPVNDSIMGIKYIIDKESSKTSPLYYDEAYSSEQYIAYRNPYALSLAFGVDESAISFDMNKYDGHMDRLNALVSSMLGESEMLELFVPIKMDDISALECETSSYPGHYSYTAESESSSYVIITATAATDGELFFYAPSEYPKATKMYVNGREKGEYFGNDSNRIISLGVFEEGDTVKVKLRLTDGSLYLMKSCDYFYYLDTEAFEDAFGRLLDGPQYKIDDGYTDSHLTGTISTAKDGQTILTTIPFDKGWKIYLDGEEIEAYEAMNALIAFDIPTSGDHTLEMKYSPAIYKLGMTVSVIGFTLFIAICALELISKKLLRRLLKLGDTLPEAEYWTLEDFDEDAAEYAALAEQNGNGTVSETADTDTEEAKQKNEETLQKTDQDINDGGI